MDAGPELSPELTEIILDGLTLDHHEKMALCADLRGAFAVLREALIGEADAITAIEAALALVSRAKYVVGA